MSAATTLLPLYAFMVYTGETLPFFILLFRPIQLQRRQDWYKDTEPIPTVHPCTGLYRSWVFQEDAPRFPGNRHMKLVRLPDLRNGRLYPTRK